MTSEQYKRIRELFVAVHDLPPAEQVAHLDRETNVEPEVRREVDRLLVESARKTPFLESPLVDNKVWDQVMADTIRDGGPDALIGRTIGRYRVVRRVGPGGMGVVYEAEQESPKRRVALKLIKPGILSQQALHRFKLETEFLGRLQHPVIAQIYEAGMVSVNAGEGAQPYFAMEYIEGKPLTVFAAEHKLSTDQRLELMRKVCDGVLHAHQKGVIHRDLKPENILVTASGEPKILDFGVARATDSDIQATTVQTNVGQLIGTLQYMSPEQAGGDPAAVDIRSDVYALGVITYELLAGRLPHDLRKRMIHDAVRVIREEESTPLSSINRVFRGDVDIIVRTALEKDKERRYASVHAFASDIERYLRNEPITARPPGTWYQLGKFARRNKALSGSVGATFVILVAAVIVSGYALAGQSEATALADEKSRELKEAEEQIVEFQIAQHSDLRFDKKGADLRSALLEERRKVLASGGQNEQMIEVRLSEFEQALAGVNFTNLAMASLDEAIFERPLAEIDEQFAGRPLVKARLLQAVASTLRDYGLLDRATEPQEAAVRILRESQGDDHPSTLKSINEMGHLLLEQGRLPDAELCFREAIDGQRRVLGDDHGDTLDSKHNLGYLCLSKGEYDAAEPLLRGAVDGYRRKLGDDHRNTLGALNNMGLLLQAQKKWVDAETAYREAMDGSRRVLGKTDKDTISAISNMGYLYQAQGKFAEAEPYYREALEANRCSLGDDHPNTLVSINNMATLLRNMERHEEAEPLWAEAVRRARATLPEGNHNIGIFLANYAATLAAMKRFSDAEASALEARAIFEAMPSATADLTSRINNELVKIYDAWHIAEPGGGHDLRAAELRRAGQQLAQQPAE